MTRIEQEPDAISGRALGKAGALIVAAMAICIPLTWLLADCGADPRVEESPPPSTAGRLELDLFSRTSMTSEQERRAARERATSWGWVDPQRRRVHVPLEIAIEIYLARREAR
jgi:hypothetical protein